MDGILLSAFCKAGEGLFNVQFQILYINKNILKQILMYMATY